jgi:hypothetical protein
MPAVFEFKKSKLNIFSEPLTWSLVHVSGHWLSQPEMA